MAQEFWSDKPLTITISGKSPNNSGIPKIDITGEKGIICGPTITSTETSLNSSVSNSAAGSSANSVSTKFYASCQWDNPRRLTTDVNTYGNIPGCGKSTGNIKVKVWWDSVKKGDSSDDTYVEQTISNVTIKNAVETIDITGLSYSNGNPIPFKNGVYALNGYNELDGIYVNYRLKGEYHESTATSSTNLTYMPIYDSTVRVNINNTYFTYFDSYTCVTPGTVEQYTINGKYFIPTKFNESTSAASTNGSIGAGSIGGGDVVGPGDIVATPFPAGTFQIMLQAIGGYRQPSTAVTLDVAELEPDYLCFTSTGVNTISMQQYGTPNTSAGKVIQYKLNDGPWQNWDLSDVSLSDGDKMYLKSNDTIPMTEMGEEEIYKQFKMTGTGTIAASGNIMSLFNFSDTLPELAFYNLFSGCESLTQAPALPATTLSLGCYGFMFSGCSKLVQAPELPATELAESCYYGMFLECIGLTTAPELPATTLSLGCYAGMFAGCTSLTQAPELPATTLVEGCYSAMFNGCNKLNYIKALFTTKPDATYTESWVDGVSPKGTFVKSKDATWKNVYGPNGIPPRWSVQVEGGVTPEPEKDYLCFTSTGVNTISMQQYGTPNTSAGKVIQYKLNDGPWQNWDLSDVSLSDCDTMYLKSDDTIPMSEMSESDGMYDVIYKQFSMHGDGSIAAYGNIMSLLNFSDTLTDYAFYCLFKDCSSLTQAPELPATTLTNYCYNSMFYGCTSLTQAPELPATTLATNCYYDMFSGCSSLTKAPSILPATTLTESCYSSMFYYCTSLTQAPELPATTLAVGCYKQMFSECSSLTQAPELPATTLAESCYYDMFSGCSSLTKAPSILPATTLAYSCYSGMFFNCSSLTQAPELPATTLATNCYYSMFQDCHSLTQAPELPATTLAEGCYQSMFQGCSKLVQAPKLPATTLATGCYYAMFYDCTLLTQAPELPATTLATDCYNSMFQDCHSLTRAPELPATTLAESCYNSMFSRCSSLTQAPELPATTLATGCYNSMFSGCSSLNQAPSILPATTLADSCYYNMFSRCSSLTQAPELPATTLVDSCYNSMFSGCKKLNYIKALFTTTPSYTYTNGWVSGVSSTGTFVKSKDATWNVTGTNGIPSGWTVQVEADLCFTSTGNSTVAMTQHGKPNKSANKVIQYKLNDGQWQTWDLSAVSLGDGDKMYLKSNDTIPIAESSGTYKQFVMTGSITASGSIMSLLNFSTTLTTYAFYKLFNSCSSLTIAPELPATTLAQSCYDSMFSQCKSLTTAPELQATILAPYCYQNMLKGCTSLTHAPNLPATTLTRNCYASMFSGCTSLTTAPELPATTLEEWCYSSMFSGCSSLTQAPELPATTLVARCYISMFKGCTSLTHAPNLPATTLSSNCYVSMFEKCTSLITAPELHATTLANGCYNSMFYGCSSLTHAPELPATKLVSGCYTMMFKNCTKLNYIKAMFTTTPSDTYTNSWVSGVSKTGTFVKSKDATWNVIGVNGIPNGWTVQVEPEKDYLCFTSTGNSTVAMHQKGTPNKSANKVIQYKLNNGQWQTWDLSAVTLADGDKMYLKSDDEIPISESAGICKKFEMTGSIAASGNTMSLLNFSTTLSKYAFFTLFVNCTSLTQAPELPATTLAESCYKRMFESCSSLTQAPSILPATTLATVCYDSMFRKCTALTEAPTLPADTLALSCYSGMFSGCTSLTTAPELPATTLANGCYNGMFYGCTSLTTAPELPATTLVDSCYGGMFSGCSKLNYVKAMFTAVPSNITGAYVTEWLSAVSPTGTFVKNSAATWTKEQAYIPAGWTVQTA